MGFIDKIKWYFSEDDNDNYVKEKKLGRFNYYDILAEMQLNNYDVNNNQSLTFHANKLDYKFLNELRVRDGYIDDLRYKLNFLERHFIRYNDSQLSEIDYSIDKETGVVKNKIDSRYFYKSMEDDHELPYPPVNYLDSIKDLLNLFLEKKYYSKTELIDDVILFNSIIQKAEENLSSTDIYYYINDDVAIGYSEILSIVITHLLLKEEHNKFNDYYINEKALREIKEKYLFNEVNEDNCVEVSKGIFEILVKYALIDLDNHIEENDMYYTMAGIKIEEYNNSVKKVIDYFHKCEESLKNY